MVTMLGLFDLKKECSESGFKVAFDSFASHLADTGYVVAWRFMTRSPHSGYDAEEIEMKYQVVMEFESETRSQFCWDYVEKNTSPLKEFHQAVNSQVENASFTLYKDID